MLHNYCSHAHSTRRTHRREVPLSSMFRVIDLRNPFLGRTLGKATGQFFYEEIPSKDAFQ